MSQNYQNFGRKLTLRHSCGHKRNFQGKPKNSTGFILISANGGLNQQRVAVVSVIEVVSTWENLKLQCTLILDAICALLESMLHLDGVVKDKKDTSPLRKMQSEWICYAMAHL